MDFSVLGCFQMLGSHCGSKFYYLCEIIIIEEKSQGGREMADLTWDELKKVVKGWTISVAEKFGITEIRCHSTNITNVVLSLVNVKDDEERAKIMDFFITRLNV